MARILFVCFICVGVLMQPLTGVTQSATSVRELEKTFATYPFSDPDPVPNATNIYPYFRFDGFTDQPVQKKWKVVVLENDFIKVWIMPEIGGKIWTAIDKKNGKPFIYNNDVVKFRDIAMRGAWTSGGIEINYGIIGHTPGVATPVNYLTRKNADGSASCILSLLDLLTGTRWSLEVRLPKDKAYFITRSTWHNGTGVYQPYYTWLNMAGKVTDSLAYIFPGTHYIGHDGSVHSWPYNEETGKNLSIYGQNNFGGSKSYHVTGKYSKYYGAYWQKEDFGMIHYAPRQDKIGKKIFIWGLSEQGMIWDKILSDHAGQYTEMQSGRLYNQNAAGSVKSPFKQFYFMPYNTDTWSEYWYPFEHTDGVTAADLNGVIHLKQNNDSATVFLSPVRYIRDTLKVWDTSGRLVYRKPLQLAPLQATQLAFSLSRHQSIGQLTLGQSVINVQDSAAKALSRPLQKASDLDWTSAYGLYLKGKYASGTRHYGQAEKDIRASLDKGPDFIPALTEMAYLQYRKMNYDSAFYYSRQALQVDTYDPAANYYYGLAAVKLNKGYDAADGFQVATLTPSFRAAAYTELAKMQIRKHRYENAYADAAQALVYNTKNLTALQLQYLAASLRGHPDTVAVLQARILKLDPLNHFIRFEDFWKHKTSAARKRFTDWIRDELPAQTYLHLAIWYHDLGLKARATTVLAVCPDKNDEILYWLAYLHRDDGEGGQWLQKADAGDPHFVFPYRAESKAVMEWAEEQSESWKPRYYLALLEQAHRHQEKALQLLQSIKGKIGFAPLYVTRARLRDASDTDAIENDYRMAVVNSKDWHYGKALCSYLLSLNKADQALTVIVPYYKADPRNYIVGMLYVRCLMLTDRYREAEKVLGGLHILPYEGARAGHRLYTQIKLMLALKELQQQHYKAALQKVAESRQWPEHLGEGKPYPAAIHDSLQNGLEELIRDSQQRGTVDKEQLARYMEKVGGKGH